MSQNKGIYCLLSLCLLWLIAKVKEEEEDESSEDEEDGDEEDIVDEMADLIKDIEENGNGGKEETDESGKVKQEAGEKTSSKKKKKNKKKKQQEQQEQQGNKTEGSKPPTTPKAANKNKDKPAQTPAVSGIVCYEFNLVSPRLVYTQKKPAIYQIVNMINSDGSCDFRGWDKEESIGYSENQRFFLGVNQARANEIELELLVLSP